MFANVIISNPHKDIDMAFDYIVPKELENKVRFGMRVRVPFGRGSKEHEGYVIGVSEATEVEEDKLKSILSVPDDFPVFSETMLEVAEWMRERYFATLSACLQTIIPGGIKDNTNYYINVKYVRPSENMFDFIGVYDNDKRKYKRAEVLNYIAHNGEVPLAELKKAVKGSDYAIDALKKDGCIEVYTKKQLTKPYVSMLEEEEKKIELNEEQKNALEIWEEERKGENRPILIHGVTGSGKTELYIRMLEKVISEGKQAIVLVPEISLTPLMTGRLIRRFGSKAAVTHSKMNYRERFTCWKMAQDGEISIVIGPRSALFMPFDNIGLVIVDEEHENSYQSETYPMYNAIETAEKICQLNGASMVMGTATPSVKTYYRAKQGKVRYVRLAKRANGTDEPVMELADMREELVNGNRSMLSVKLFEAVKYALDNGNQVILFMNRRGYSTFISCRNCGYVLKCSHCDVSYKYHSTNGKLMCHYCGETIDKPDVCPVCGSDRIRYFGGGTQKLEAEIRKYFPRAGVIRMDSDTVSGKNGYTELLQKFGEGKAKVLIGTQMIAKGHDFPNVTLVGILAADMLLNTGEFDGGEKTFQLITQAAGRAGRGSKEGRVIVQTYSPDNASVQAAVKGETEKFYENEIKFRKSMGYPPCELCAEIDITGMDEKNVSERAAQLGYELEKYGVEVLGPVPAYISKIKDEYRWRATARSENSDLLRKAVSEVYEKLRNEFEVSGVYLSPRIL